MTTLRICLSLAVGLVVVAVSWGDEARGRIVGIDPDKKIIRLEIRRPLRGGGGVLELHVQPQTQVLIGGQPAALKDLAPNRRIRVVFEVRGGKATAVMIRSFGLNLAPPSPLPAAAPAAAPLKQGEGVTGTLRRVGLADHEIVIIGPGAKGAKTETVVGVTKDTVITRNGKKIALDGLKEGETATVKTKKDKDRLTAAAIQVGQVAATPAVPAPASPAPPRRNLIPRVRRALQMADELLRQLEEGGSPRQPARHRRPADK